MKHVEGYTAGEKTAAEKKNISTSDLIHFCGNWVWRAVEALVQAKDFNPDPAWIADRLNISASAAKDALEGLERIGMIIRSGDSFAGSPILENYDYSDIDRSDRFEIHNKIKDQISAKITSRDSYLNVVLPSSPESIKEFYEGFCNLVEQLNAKNIAGDNANDIYAMELSLARLTREQR